MDLIKAIRQSWDTETARGGVWHPENPALNQCVPTALLLYDRFGGRILKTKVNGISHYLNEIDYKLFDLTAEQFSPCLYGMLEEVDPAKLLKNKDVKRRYLLLKERVDSLQ